MTMKLCQGFEHRTFGEVFYSAVFYTLLGMLTLTNLFF